MNRFAEPFRRVLEGVEGYQVSRLLHVAIQFDVFSKLADTGKTATQLATLLHLEPRALELLLNALTGLGFLRKDAERFHATPVSQTYLTRQGPKYMGHLVRFQSRRWAEWEQLAEVIRTGKPVRPSNLFEEDPEELEDFVHAMHELALARGDARYMARAIPLKRCQKLVDIGGGPGTYAALLCRANRNLHAVVQDLPATLKITRRILRSFDQTGRITTMACDYRRDRIKGGPYDVALLSNILHTEDDKTNRQLLQKVYKALNPGGILIVKDHVLSPDRTEPKPGAVFSIAMLLGSQGRAYSFAEMSSWMEAAGFRDMVEIHPDPPMTSSIVVALRPGKRALAVLPRPTARVDARVPETSDPEPVPDPHPAATLTRPAHRAQARSRKKPTPTRTRPGKK